MIAPLGRSALYNSIPACSRTNKAIGMAGGGSVPQTGAGGPATIPLGRLIDFVLQQTYHELTVLAELLPRKSDMERKIEITTFTNTTRQLFVRLLALVKWAASAGKVEKCASMVNFLDKQSLLFIEAADMFALLARDTLVQARLPSFHIPCAAEILTTGTYSRLPTCIRDKIVPPDPISTEDKRSTLKHLNRIIQYRLVSSELPPQMSSIDIKRGRVIFRVDNEFEVSLTLMGDGPQVPWRLLSINILVEDKDTGDCRALVHPLQINYIHQLIQSRLVDHPKPLHELFECLHFFCLSLQLEVVHSQILRLCRERLGDSVRIEEYIPGSSLRLHFWREHISLLDHRPFVLMVHVDAEQPCKPLQVSHSPEITEKAEQIWVEPCIRSEFLSIEKLLIQTIHIRSRQKLAYLKETYLKELLPVGVECTLSGSPPLLQLPVVHPCSSSEHLVLTVDTHTGYIMAFVPQYEPPMVTELQDTINNLVKGAQPALRARLASATLSLKFWMTLKRCKKTVQHLPVLAMDTNPFVQAPEEHRINQLSKYSLFVKLCKHAHYYVIIDLQAERPSDNIEFRYYLMSITSDNRLSSFYELDAHSIVHGPCTDVDILTSSTSVIGLSSSIHSSSSNALKRPSSSQEKPVLTKKPKCSDYFFSDIAHIVAFCDDRLPFCSLTRELESRGISHRGLQIEGAQTNFCVNVVQMPLTRDNGLSEEVAGELRHSLLSCTFRLQVKGIKAWLCKLVFHDCPLTTSNVRERGATRPVYFMYDFSQNNTAAVVEGWLADWAVVCKLYGVVARYVSDMKKPKHAPLLEMFEVRSYTYTRLTLAYGSEKNDTVTISWSTVERRFQLVFGVVGPSVSATNPHVTIAHQLSYDFNQHESVIQLVQALRDTYRPLLSLSRLPSTPQLGVINSRPTVPVQTFVIIPQSSTCFKLIYRGNYCLEVQCRKGDGCVIIRDGAFSHFDKGRHVEEFVPIPDLRDFLGKFTGGCEAPQDTENPVSPVELESVDAFLSPSQAKGAASSPASNRSATADNALRFPQHHPMTPPSNPHTPASPHPSMLHSNYTASPNSSFVHTPSNVPPSSPLAPPPSSPYPVNSPHMTSPSPSPAQQPPSQQSFATAAAANDPTSPAFPLLSASPANAWPSSPAPPRPSPRPFQPSPGGPSPAQPPSVEVRQPPIMSRVASPHPGNWVAAMPIVLTHEKLDQLCSFTSPGPSPVERFLGCAFMRNFIQRYEESAQGRTVTGLIPDSGIVTFRLDPLVYRVSLNPSTMQALHVKISPIDPNKEQLFTVDEIQVVERYFDAKVASIPYKPNAFISFYRLMSCTQRILRDFIQLMRLELCPPQTPMFRWNFQLCLTIPPAVPQIAPPGMTSMLIVRNKMLFFMQLSPAGPQNDSSNGQINLPGQPLLVIPLVYDFQTNSITIAADRRSNGELSGQTLQAMNIINQILRQGPEYQNNGECTIFTSIRDVLTQLVIS